MDAASQLDATKAFPRWTRWLSYPSKLHTVYCWHQDGWHQDDILAVQSSGNRYMGSTDYVTVDWSYVPLQHFTRSKGVYYLLDPWGWVTVALHESPCSCVPLGSHGTETLPKPLSSGHLYGEVPALSNHIALHFLVDNPWKIISFCVVSSHCDLFLNDELSIVKGELGHCWRRLFIWTHDCCYYHD